VPEKIWTLKEARAVLPVVIRITDKAVRKSASIVNFLEKNIVPEIEQERQEAEVQRILNEWAGKLSSMGVVVKGLWLADFDNGRGYYCWKYGEQELLYEHDYDSGYAGRKLIEETEIDGEPGEG